MNRLEISVEQALELLDSSHVVKDEIVDTSRWSIHHCIVVEYEGKFWETSYSVGATEHQDESPWGYDTKVELIEVEQIEEIIKVWRPVI